MLVIFASGAFSNPSWSQENDSILAANDSRQQRSPSGKSVVEQGETVVRDSSEFSREGKRVFIGYEAFGLNPLASTGFMAGMYLSPDSIVDLSWTNGKFEWLGFEMKSTAIAVRYKSFNGNSFYWRAGGMFRTYEYDASYYDLSSAQTSNGTVKISATGLDLGIGNQWQWDTFSLGCDWIGAFIAVTGSSSVSRAAGATDAWYDKEVSDAKSISKKGNLQLLRFYLGVSF